MNLKNQIQVFSDFPVDFVITYVDDRDPVWLEKISKYPGCYSPSRYRSWGLLKYILRGVDKYMPFVRKVHLVVSNIEQVPDFIDRENVHVVLHEEIIPEVLVPTFNSTTIEMFLNRIEGLSEHFIYSNDDILVMRMTDCQDFFDFLGRPIYSFKKRTSARNTYRMQCRNSYELASRLAGRPKTKTYFFPRHSMAPMLKSVFDEIHEKAGDTIIDSCTKFREPFNYTQYLFPIYSFFTGRASLGNMSYRYFSVGNDFGYMKNVLQTMKQKMVCINDSDNVVEINEILRQMLDFFENKFNEKSRFEKQ